MQRQRAWCSRSETQLPGSNPMSGSGPKSAIRFFSAVCIVLAGCAGPGGSDVEAEKEVTVQRGAESSSSEFHDLSAPLTLMPPAVRHDSYVEHPVKPIPRKYTRTSTVDPVQQATAPSVHRRGARVFARNRLHRVLDI